jgi:hypothetical protein
MEVSKKYLSGQPLKKDVEIYDMGFRKGMAHLNAVSKYGNVKDAKRARGIRGSNIKVHRMQHKLDTGGFMGVPVRSLGRFHRQARWHGEWR